MDAQDLVGIWSTKDDQSKIEIYKCGEKYCGKVVDLKEKVYPEDHERAGQPKVDLNNKKKERRNDPIIGLNLMKGFKFKGKLWEGGTIYDPDNGKTYKCQIKLPDNDTLEVRGYIGIPALGRTEVWTRAK